MFKLLKNNFFIIALVGIAIVSHVQWFNFYSILNSSDWSFWVDDAVKGLSHTYGSWGSFFGYGSVNIQMPFLLFKSMWSFVVWLGYSYDVAVKLTFLIPIALLGFLSPYILSRKLTKNDYISFVVALFYGSATYFLVRQTAHLPVAFIYAFAPLVFYYFLNAVQNNKFSSWLIFLLAYFIGICYELRMMYIFTYILALYLAFFKWSYFKRYFLRFSLIAILLVLINTFWLAPMLLGGVADAVSATANRGLFGNFLFDVLHAFALSDSPWTGSLADANFKLQPIFWYLWLVPVISFLALILDGERKYKKNILFFSIVGLIGVFLTKQGGAPFEGAYLWLYENFPGFNLFREASKFYILTAFGYAGLLGYSLMMLKEHKKIFAIISVSIILLSVLNLKPLITGEIGTMFTQKHMPADYSILNSYLAEQPGYFLTLWMPRDSRWGYFTSNKSKASATEIRTGAWNELFKSVYKTSFEEDLLSILQKPFSGSLMNYSSTRYVIVPVQDIENADDFFIHYGGRENKDIRQWYVDELDKVQFLKKIDIGTTDLVVYENEGYKDHIYLFESLHSFNGFENLDKKYDLVSGKLGKDFYFIKPELGKSLKQITDINNVFENISLKNITDGGLVNNFAVDPGKISSLHAGSDIAVGEVNVNGLPVSVGSTTQVSLNADNLISYTESGRDFSSVILNGSFDEGTWQEEVGDCNNADKNGLLSMSLNTSEKTDGAQSLQLEATRHIACTSIRIDVASSSTYLLSFDYQSPNAKEASYYIGFNDPTKKHISEALPLADTNWHTFSKTIEIPEGTTALSLFLYARATDGETNIINRYDNVSLIAIPDLRDAFYIVSEPKLERSLVEPRAIEFELINPTKKLVHIKGATTPFFLAMSESYHDKWQLQFNNEKVNGFFRSWVPFVTPDRVADEYHYKLNGFLNGWYVSTEELCAGARDEVLGTSEMHGCTRNADGSYDIEMVIEFFPQRWFYLGLLISGTTFAGCLGYLGYAGVRAVRRRLRGEKGSDDGFVAEIVVADEVIEEEVAVPMSLRALLAYLRQGIQQGVHDVRKKPWKLLLATGVSFASVYGMQGVGTLWTTDTDTALLWSLFLTLLVYRWDSRIAGVLAILALIACPILLALPVEWWATAEQITKALASSNPETALAALQNPLAEQMAVYAFYFLVMTVALQIIEFKRYPEEPNEEKKGNGMQVRKGVVDLRAHSKKAS